MNANPGHETGENDSEGRRLARGSILGSLSDEEQQEFDRRFIGTPAFADLAYEVETDLVDAYAAGKLDLSEQEALERWAIQSSRNALRLQSALALRKVLQTRSQTDARKLSDRALRDTVGFSSFLRLQWAIGIAIVFLVVIGALIFRASRSTRAPGVEQATTAVSSPPAPSPSQATAPAAPTQLAAKPPVRSANSLSQAPIFLATLIAYESRGQSSVQTIALPAGIREVRLQLTSEIDIPDGQYTAVLTSGSSREVVWQKSHLYHAGKPFVTLSLSNQIFTRGSYMLTLQPDGPGTNQQPLTFRFTVV